MGNDLPQKEKFTFLKKDPEQSIRNVSGLITLYSG